MGTPLPPHPIGNDCDVCWGDGAIFGPLPTPHFVQALVTGIQKGWNWNPPYPPPPNGLWELSQIDSCLWQLNTEFFVFTYHITGSSCYFRIRYLAMFDVFSGGTSMICATTFSNLNPGRPDLYTGGYTSVAV